MAAPRPPEVRARIKVLKGPRALTGLVIYVLLCVNAAAQSAMYTYDALNRLTSVAYPNGTTIVYTYDAAGNRTTKTVTVVAAPELFSHISPANGAIGTSTSPTLSWADSAGATSYEYCLDTTDNGTCDTAWTSTGATTNVGLSGLNAGTPYYWHVRAINIGGTTYAEGDAETFWSFTTHMDPPAAFGKSAPANSSTAQPSSPALSWGASSGATSYEYCYDTTNDNACAGWLSTGLATTVELSGLTASSTYYWQVRALNAGGTTYSDGTPTMFWSFTTGLPAPAFGQVDTPSQNAAGVQGAIGVTGWALDDVGVTKVEIFRNCLLFEPQNCQTVLGQSVVYVGDAAFLAGARPDVAAAFPTYPQNARAGWGYLMLTPMLPDVTNSLPYGGQGALTLYAVATDSVGNKTLLGRSSDSQSSDYTTPTAITMSNATIAKPFGAIDTPGQGGTISGVFNNFGWALTPDTNTTGGDPDDIVIPTNGSTMTVFIDGLPTALVAYNQCRGSVGNPVPVGLYCNDDVANIFGNPIPLAPLTTRTSNPTLFRNLDAGRAAIGAFTFDTTTLTNGLHTIAWSVTDSAGRTEGIGSRFFLVSNGAVSPQVEADMRAAPAQRLGSVSTLKATATVTDGVWTRTGFALAAPWARQLPTGDGDLKVQLPQLERVELWLGAPVEKGYLLVGDELRALPVGSTLAGSVFAWTPPAGYLGAYRLVFERGGERIDVQVIVR